MPAAEELLMLGGMREKISRILAFTEGSGAFPGSIAPFDAIKLGHVKFPKLGGARHPKPSYFVLLHVHV